MNKVFIFGPRYSGKTVLLSVMADQLWLQRFEKKMFLGYSTKFAMLASLSPSYGKFPKCTKIGTYDEFDFNVYYRSTYAETFEIPDLSFSVSDYSGIDVVSGRSAFISKLQSSIDDADMVIIIVDGFALLNYFRVQTKDIDFGTLNLGDNRFSRTKFNNILMRCKAENKKCCVVVSKCDYVNIFLDSKELIKKMREKLLENIDIAIIPISSTGAGVTEDEIVCLEKRVGENCVKVDSLVSEVKGPLKPENIDVLFMFILSNFIKKHFSRYSFNNLFVNDLYRIMVSINHDFVMKYPEAVPILRL